MKTCIKCKTNKDISEFYDKTRNTCKECIKHKSRIYFETNKDRIIEHRKSNKESIKQYNKDRYNVNKEEIKLARIEYRKTNIDNIKQYEKTQRIKHNNKRKEYGKKYREHNREKCLELNRNYYINNRESLNKKALSRHNNRIKNDDYYKFIHQFRIRLIQGFKEHSLKGKTASCKEYGINFKEIYERIGARPAVNYHLDHIIPLSKFNLDNNEHVKLANCPNNLRWILSTTNLKKTNKLTSDILLDPILIDICRIINLDISTLIKNYQSLDENIENARS